MNEAGNIGPWGGVSSAGNADTAGRPLRIFFVHDYGRPVVYAAATMAILLIIVGYARQDAIMMILSLMPIAASAYHLPAMQNINPQLIVSDEGIFVDGLGVIPWNAISEVELFNADPEETEDSELILKTSEALEYILQPQTDLTLMRTFQIMIWRLEDIDVIRLQLSPLNVDPGVLFQDVRRRRRGLYGWDS